MYYFQWKIFSVCTGHYYYYSYKSVSLQNTFSEEYLFKEDSFYLTGGIQVEEEKRRTQITI